MSRITARGATAAAIALSLAAALAGCSTTKVAQPKTTTEPMKLEWSGTYETRPGSLVIKVNGDPVLSGNFSSFSPTLNLKNEYRGLQLAANCYFGSVLGSRGGIQGIVANAVQGGLGKSGDKCDLYVGEKMVEALYF